MPIFVPFRTPEQAAATAKRHNKKVEKKFPLLAYAGLIPDEWLWTTESVLEDERSFRSGMERFDQECRRLSKLLRFEVVGLVTPEELSRMDNDHDRYGYDKRPEYSCDFWSQQLRRLGIDDWWQIHNPLATDGLMEVLDV